MLYSVTATLPIAEVDGYLAWLDNHINELLRAGALEASVIVYPPCAQTQQVKTQYTFADRSSFDSYEEIHAPRLREEGRQLFGSKPGVTFARRLGEIRWRRDARADKP
ncbi:MAG TPA: DUF4286 family protein [Tepidisphaeraceae bacterium]|nr:DUF4286 family protein [Tepidisphaeraceae bacterium]